MSGRKIEVRCLHTSEKKRIKPTSKGFKRTGEGKVYYHCLLREDCAGQIGCNGILYLTPGEKAKFLPEELNKIPVC